MEVIYARELNLGEQNADGTYKMVRDDGTFCEKCLIKNRWGYTTYVDDQPGDKCEVCGEQ